MSEAHIPGSAPARYQVLLVTLLCVNFGILFFDRNALNFLMPYVQPELGLSYTEVGLLGSVLSGFATSFLMLLAARLIMGLSEGGVMPLSHAMVANEVAPEKRGIAMGITQNLGSSLMGSTLAPLILVPIALAWGWRNAFFIAALPGLISAALIWLLVIERKLPPPALRVKGDRPPVMELLANRNVLVCSFIAVVLVAYLVVTWGFMPLVLVQLRGIEDITAGWLMATLGVASAICSFLIPWLSDIYGRRPVMAGFTLVGVILPLGALYFDGPALVLGLIFFVGWMFNGIFPMFMATVPLESVAP